MPQLIVFSHLRWNFVYQRPQHLLTRLARHYPVLFIEEPVRDDGPPRLQCMQVQPGVEVLRPYTSIEAPGFHDDQLPLLQPLLEDHFREHAGEAPVVWFYTPMALPLLALLQPGLVVYDCMDELSAFKSAPRQLRQREAALLKRAGVVLTGGPSLYDAKRELHPNVLCMPSAVDARHFSPGHALAQPAELAQAERLQGHLPRPRLGFYGVIDERLDLQLVERLADSDPSWQIIMVGPVVKIDPASLPRRPNIHWLGQQSYEVLPQLIAGWDVCLLLFALNDATRYISPTKTLEYMAAEKPVVSTAVRDVKALYGDVVDVAPDHAAFIAACRKALNEDGHRHGQRIADALVTVSRFSWNNTAADIHTAIEAARTRPALQDGPAPVAAVPLASAA